MRVNPGESYADIHDWDYERACLRERAIANLEPVARERCEQYFIDNAETSRKVFDALIDHDAVTAVLCSAPASGDECELGRSLFRAVSAARMKFTNTYWQAFAKFAISHRGEEQTWPVNDNDVSEGMR